MRDFFVLISLCHKCSQSSLTYVEPVKNIPVKRFYFFSLHIDRHCCKSAKTHHLLNVIPTSNQTVPCHAFNISDYVEDKNMLSVIVFRRLQSSSTFISFKIITFILKRLSFFVNYFVSESRSGHQVAESVGWDTLHKSVSSGTDRRHYPLLTVFFCIWMHPRAPSLAEGRATNISNPSNIVRAHECWQSRHMCNYSVIPPQMWFLLHALRVVTPHSFVIQIIVSLFGGIHLGMERVAQ